MNLMSHLVKHKIYLQAEQYFIILPESQVPRSSHTPAASAKEVEPFMDDKTLCKAFWASQTSR